jgi:hypothetical protein
VLGQWVATSLPVIHGCLTVPVVLPPTPAGPLFEAMCDDTQEDSCFLGVFGSDVPPRSLPDDPQGPLAVHLSSLRAREGCGDLWRAPRQGLLFDSIQALDAHLQALLPTGVTVTLTLPAAPGDSESPGPAGGLCSSHNYYRAVTQATSPATPRACPCEAPCAPALPGAAGASGSTGGARALASSESCTTSMCPCACPALCAVSAHRRRARHLRQLVIAPATASASGGSVAPTGMPAEKRGRRGNVWTLARMVLKVVPVRLGDAGSDGPDRRAPFTYNASVGVTPGATPDTPDRVYVVAPWKHPSTMCCSTYHGSVTIHGLLDRAARSMTTGVGTGTGLDTGTGTGTGNLKARGGRVWSPLTVTRPHLIHALSLGGTFPCGASYRLEDPDTWDEVGTASGSGGAGTRARGSGDH